ncbi:hypothetical protein D3C86_1621610 [compost metagenome]
MAERFEFTEQLQGAAAQLAGGEHFRRDGRKGEIGCQDGHLQQHATCALGVDQQQVITGTEMVEQIAQP